MAVAITDLGAFPTLSPHAQIPQEPHSSSQQEYGFDIAGCSRDYFFLQKSFQACSVRGHFQLYWANDGRLFEYCEWSLCCKLMELQNLTCIIIYITWKLTYTIPQMDMMHPLLEMIFCGDCIFRGRLRACWGPQNHTTQASPCVIKWHKANSVTGQQPNRTVVVIWYPFS